jgi:integrase
MMSPEGLVTLTAQALQKLAKVAGGSLSESLGRGAGTLEFRVRQGGVFASYRHRAYGSAVREPLGVWPLLSLAELRAKARDLAQKKASGAPLRQEKAAGTLAELLADYVKSLKNARTAREASACFKRTVPPSFLPRPASSITGEQVLDWLRKRVAAGASRDVNLARSYLHAAFALPLKAKGDPRAAAASSTSYGIKTNPVAATIRVAEWDRARDRVLTDDEIRLLWKSLDAADIEVRRAIRLLLHTGQRIQQLLAGTMQGGKLRQLDAKGRRAAPRVHVIPLPEAARPLVAGYSDGEELFAVTHWTVSNHVARLNAGFELSDVRRTVETRMAGLGVSKDVRAQLLSHGISGVQAKHYDHNDYSAAMLDALEKWSETLARILA